MKRFTWLAIPALILTSWLSAAGYTLSQMSDVPAENLPTLVGPVVNIEATRK